MQNLQEIWKMPNLGDDIDQYLEFNFQGLQNIELALKKNEIELKKFEEQQELINQEIIEVNCITKMSAKNET